MKIFSLQSKSYVILWSVVIGYVLNFIAYKYTRASLSCLFAPTDCPDLKGGWPFLYEFYKNNYYLVYCNLIFWVLVSYISLSLIKYFKNKNKPASS